MTFNPDGPQSGFTFEAFFGLEIAFYMHTDMPIDHIGASSSSQSSNNEEILNILRNNKFTKTFDNIHFQSKMCIFYALAAREHHNRSEIKKEALILLRKFCKKKCEIQPDFKWKENNGINIYSVENRIILEDIIKKNIFFYKPVVGDKDVFPNIPQRRKRKSDDDEKPKTPTKRNSVELLFPIDRRYVHDEMILIVGNHAIHVIDWIQFSRSWTQTFVCKKCSMGFQYKSSFMNHNCFIGAEEIYKGGIYEIEKNIIEEINELCNLKDPDVNILKYRNPFAVFDMESFMVPMNPEISDDSPENVFHIRNQVRNTKTTEYIRQHIPCTTILGSNFGSFVGENIKVNFIDEKYNCAALIEEFVLDLLELQSEIPVEEGYRKYIDAVTILCNSNNSKIVQIGNSLMDRLRRFLFQLPVLGFNSSKYDLPLISEWLIYYLNKYQQSFEWHGAEKYPAIYYSKFLSNQRKVQRPPSILKRGNTYISISTSEVQFLDVVRYYPGTNLRNFLKLFGSNVEEKFYFPYKYLRDGWSPLLEERDSLPPYEDFWDDLKGGYLCSPEEYIYVGKIWKEKKWKTLKEMLKYYSVMDVGPLIGALEKVFVVECVNQ